MHRSIAIAAALLLLLGGCSDQPTTDDASQTSEGTAPDVGDETKKDDSSSKGKPKAGSDKKDPGGDNVDAQGSIGGGKDRTGAKSKSGGGSGSSDGAQAAATGHPAAGRYVYSQEGFEEFCQTTSCDRSDLPPEQEVSVKVDGNTVVSEVRASHSRMVRTTYEFTDEKALIKEVHTKVNYQNVQMEDTYRPDPPVEALRFPLRSGMSWSGKWKAKTSGDYSIAITRQESVEVGGRTIDAFRIETETHFRGQFEGKAVGVVWIDPETNLPVKAEGTVDVKSAFGRYHSESATQLKSGPGY